MTSIKLHPFVRDGVYDAINERLVYELVNLWIDMYNATRHLQSDEKKSWSASRGDPMESCLAHYWLRQWVRIEDLVEIYKVHANHKEALVIFLNKQVEKRTADLEVHLVAKWWSRWSGRPRPLRAQARKAKVLELEEVERLLTLVPLLGIIVLFKWLPGDGDFVCLNHAHAKVRGIARKMFANPPIEPRYSAVTDQKKELLKLMFISTKLFELMLGPNAFRTDGEFDVEAVAKLFRLRMHKYLEKYMLALDDPNEPHNGVLILKEWFNPRTPAFGEAGKCPTHLPFFQRHAQDMLRTVRCMIEKAPKDDSLRGREHLQMVDEWLRVKVFKRFYWAYTRKVRDEWPEGTLKKTKSRPKKPDILVLTCKPE